MKVSLECALLNSFPLLGFLSIVSRVPPPKMVNSSAGKGLSVSYRQDASFSLPFNQESWRDHSIHSSTTYSSKKIALTIVAMDNGTSELIKRV
jgi:hypothetical protein